MEENRKGTGVFYAVVGVATLVVAIIGATFAYFSASQTNTDVAGTTASGANLSLVVTRVSDEATNKNMIPMKTTDLQKGVTGTNNRSCIDANGNTVCQVYKVTVGNGSADIGINVKGTMKLETTATNMKWEVLTDAATVDAEATVFEKGTDSIIVANQLLTSTANAATASADFYIVIWLEETNGPQDTADAGMTFNGTIKFDGVNSDGSASSGITAKFGNA